MKTTKRLTAGGAAVAAALLATLLLPAYAGNAAAAEVNDLLPLGGKAPSFQGVDLKGQPFALEEELSRGAVFLVFWSIF